MSSTTLLATCGLGLGFGLRHAFESDHIAAITTMVTTGGGPRQAAAVGASWGLGHALAVVGAGAVLVMMNVRVPASAEAILESLVAAMLIVLGVRVLRERPAGSTALPPSRRSWLRALGVGLIHGASGTAALVLTELATLPTRAHRIGFLLVFAAGTTVSMTLLSFLMASPLAAAARRSERWQRVLQVAACLFSFGAAGLILARVAG